MHPSIRQSNPGKCALCGMDLVPVEEVHQEVHKPRELKLTPHAQKLAEVQSAPVERRHAEAEIRMVGKVTFDESRMSYITARVAGRLDRLYVDYTGVRVKKEDHLVYLYSPELLKAQEELITALDTLKQLQASSSHYLRDRAQENIHSAREKLRLWGLGEIQIRNIEERGTASDHVTIHSPMEGIVVHKNAVEGMYVETGTQIYTIADLSHLWVKLDAYESDLPWIHYGQKVEFLTEAFPGEVFKGQIAFIDPVLNAKTRTVKIRVNLPNPNGKLKPDMFVRALVKSKIAKGGRIMNPDLAHKWISPMHPEIIKDAPGLCDICGMELVSADSLGYVEAKEDSAPLVIPASAPLITGKRAVVYVELGKGHYEGREVTLGPRAGNSYLVKSGLKEGERVVTRGNFKIDSALQILAKPSMMTPPAMQSVPHLPNTKLKQRQPHTEAVSTIYPASTAFLTSMEQFLKIYLRVQTSLSMDDQIQSREQVSQLRATIDNMQTGDMSHDAGQAWSMHRSAILKAMNIMESSEPEIEAIREGFGALSNSLILAVHQFGIKTALGLSHYHCPMAFDGKGGQWLQEHRKAENPYFGNAMRGCGNLKEILKENKHVHPIQP
ncbi:MAG: efflux RND transporter periplasmic adaptor subunit [Verrucomicrobiota bacterium]|nr:efflux RND transporter periplasmic adaptor subunit [Verrucomicrobiota bacterium]